MKINLLFFLTFLAFSTKSFSAYQNIVVDESTVSNVIYPSSTPGTSANPIQIFGGLTGSGTGFFGDCASITAGSTCNSCTGLTTLQAPIAHYRCAERSIYNDLEIKLTFTMDTVPEGAVLKVMWGASDGYLLPFDSSYEGLTPSANTPIDVKIKWSDICSRENLTCDGLSLVNSGFVKDLYIAVTAEATATQSNGINFKVRAQNLSADDATSLVTLCPEGATAGSNAFCYFRVLPGDQKVYLKDLARGATGPNLTGADVKWESLRVYHAASSCPLPCDQATITANFEAIPIGANALYEDIKIADKTKVDGSLMTSKVTAGLENETEYFFTIASVDETSIVSGFIDPAGLDIANHTATPGEVIGLLDKQHCFVATAAFGSEMAPQVEILRKFRNQFLLSNSWGQSFVRFYYTYSPPIAHWIAQHEMMRTVARGILWPFIVFAYLASEVGGVPAILIFFLGVLAIVRLSKIRKPA